MLNYNVVCQITMRLNIHSKLLTTLFLLLCLHGWAQPVANFTASAVSGCSPLVVNFTNTSTGAVSYVWNFGNGSPNSYFTNSSTSFNGAGVYNVVLTATDANNLTSTKTITITVYDPPNVAFYATPLSVCLGSAINFHDQSTLNTGGIPSYQWFFGNGQTGSGANVSYTYPAAGTYNISLTVTNGQGCVASATQTGYVTVNAPPIAAFSAYPTLTCTNIQVTFTNNSTAAGSPSYTWLFGDGQSSNNSNPTHAYSNPGTYTVTLVVVDGNGCHDSLAYPNLITVVAGTVAAFTGPSSICVGQSATFVNTSTPAYTACTWTFGDGSGATGSPASHAYQVAGTYNVSLNTTNNNCSDSTSHTIIVNALPVPNVTMSPAHPCPAPATVTFSTATPGTNYTWDFGDGSPTSNSQNTTHTYTTNDSFTVMLTVTNSNGCTATDTINNLVKIFDLHVTALDSFTNGCIPFTVRFFDSLTTLPGQPIPPANFSTNHYPYPGSNWTWDFGDGSPTSNLAMPYHTYTTYGTYTVHLTVTTVNGCMATDTLVVNAGTPDTANFTASPLTACVNEIINYTNLSSGATNYIWDFGDGGGLIVPAPNNNITHSYTFPGVFSVKLIAIKNGCGDTLIRSNYITVHDPESIFKINYDCSNFHHVTFTNSSIGATSWCWMFGDGSAPDSTTWNPSHVYTNMGTYTVTLCTYNDTFGCHDTLLLNVYISNPFATITTPDTAVCKNSPITLTAVLNASAIPPLFMNYTWFLDPGIIADTTSIRTHSYNSIGVKQVMMYVVDYRLCKDTAYKNVLVAWPTVNFSATPTDVCLNSPVSFSDASTDAPTTSFVLHKWIYGDGQSLGGNNPNPTHSYTLPGTFNVVEYVTDNIGCADSLMQSAYIHVHHPQADFMATDTAVCRYIGAQFYNLAQGTGLTYHWSFGDGGWSTLPNPIHAYATAGTYTVKLVITDNIGCSDSLIKTNYILVYDNPQASFTVSDTFSICYPQVEIFTNTSVGGSSYAWLFGDGNFSAFQNATDVYNQPGIYNPMLIVTNLHGCKDTAYAHIRILGYSGLITYSPLTGCEPLTVNFTALINKVPNMVYDFNDGATYATSDTFATHTYLTPGSYVPRLILYGSVGCQSTSMGNDVIKVDGVLGGYTYSPFPACGNDTVQFTDTSHALFSTITSTNWYFNDGTTSTSKTPIHSYSPGTYSVLLVESTTSGCIDSFHTVLNVYNVPVIHAGPDTTICNLDTAFLHAGGALSYVWSPAASLSCTACNATDATPTAPTTYFVVGTDVNGCKGTDSVLVAMKAKVVAHVDSFKAICQNDSVGLQASADANALYYWSPASGLNSTSSANPNASPASTTHYMVIVKEGHCIPDTVYSQVQVYPIPSVNPGPDQTIVEGGNTTIVTSSGNVMSYLWSPTNGLNCDTCSSPVAAPIVTTLYKVTVTSDFGCIDSGKVKITVICDHSQVFIPNTFTPNGDGANDRFYPHGKGLQIIKSFRIYDRWGEQVFIQSNFNTNDRDKAWDGTYNGKKLTPDVYVYVIDAICETGEPISWSGDVALLR